MKEHETHREKNGAHFTSVAVTRGRGESRLVCSILRWLAMDASQQRFQFASDLPPTLPPDMADHELTEVLTAIAQAQLQLARDMREQRNQLVSPALQSHQDRDGMSVAERLTGLERELRCLEPVMEENRKLRQRDFQFGVLAPIALGIIGVLDEFDRDVGVFKKTAANKLTKREGTLCAEACRVLDQGRHDLLGVLSRYGIEAFATEELDVFNVARHKVIKVQEPTHAAHAGRVIRSVRPGYWRRTDAWVVRPEWVNVFSGT